MHCIAKLTDACLLQMRMSQRKEKKKTCLLGNWPKQNPTILGRPLRIGTYFRCGTFPFDMQLFVQTRFIATNLSLDLFRYLAQLDICLQLLYTQRKHSVFSNTQPRHFFLSLLKHQPDSKFNPREPNKLVKEGHFIQAGTGCESVMGRFFSVPDETWPIYELRVWSTDTLTVTSPCATNAGLVV